MATFFINNFLRQAEGYPESDPTKECGPTFQGHEADYNSDRNCRKADEDDC